MRSFILCTALFLLTGCAGVTPIGDLLANPSEYNGKSVKVKGEVTKSIGALVAGIYAVRDNTGELYVVTDKGAPPPEKTTVGVKGTFQSAITVGSKSYAGLKEESRF
jgi:hypothetical protein